MWHEMQALSGAKQKEKEKERASNPLGVVGNVPQNLSSTRALRGLWSQKGLQRDQENTGELEMKSFEPGHTRQGLYRVVSG